MFKKDIASSSSLIALQLFVTSRGFIATCGRRCVCCPSGPNDFVHIKVLKKKAIKKQRRPFCTVEYRCVACSSARHTLDCPSSLQAKDCNANFADISANVSYDPHRWQFTSKMSASAARRMRAPPASSSVPPAAPSMSILSTTSPRALSFNMAPRIGSSGRAMSLSCPSQPQR